MLFMCYKNKNLIVTQPLVGKLYPSNMAALLTINCHFIDLATVPLIHIADPSKEYT